MRFYKKSENIAKLRELIETIEIKDATLKQVDCMYSTIRKVCEDGYWDWNMIDKYKYFSPTLKAQLGYEDDEVENIEGALKEMMLDEDLPMVIERLEEHFETRGEVKFKAVVRYRHKNGHIVKILCRGQVVEWGDNNEPLRMVGSHVNVTDI